MRNGTNERFGSHSPKFFSLWRAGLCAALGVLSLAARADEPMQGPVLPEDLPGGASYVAWPTNGLIEKPGGANWTFSNIVMSTSFDQAIWWGFTNNGIKISFDGPTYTNAEILSYKESLSDRTNGRAVWTGQTTNVYLRFTAQVTDLSGGPAALETNAYRPAGGAWPLLRIAPDQKYSVNMRFEASTNQTTGFLPAQQFYDLWHSTNHQPDSAKSYSSVTAGFYYRQKPGVQPGSTITNALAAGDVWRTNRAAGPGGGVWLSDDYLVQGFQPGESAEATLASGQFDAFLEVFESTQYGLVASDDNGDGGTNARVRFAIGEGTNYQVRATSNLGGGAGNYVLRLQPVLQPGRRFRNRALEISDLVEAGSYYDVYAVDTLTAAAEEVCALYQRDTNQFAPKLSLYDESSPLPYFWVAPGSGEEALLLFTNNTGAKYRVQASSVQQNIRANYEVALYRTVSSGKALAGSLATGGRAENSATNRPAAGPYYYEDVLLSGVDFGPPGEQLNRKVQLALRSAAFVPFIEVRNLADESPFVGPAGGAWWSDVAQDGTNALLTLELRPTDNVLVRVTSSNVGQTGAYELEASYADLPAITGFNPARGKPGETITLLGQNLLSGGQIYVYFTGAQATTPTPGTETATNLQVVVPAGTIKGPIAITNLLGGTVSSQVFETTTPLEDWRLKYFGSWENQGPGRDDADPDLDGAVNLTEYGMGLNPTNRDPIINFPEYGLAEVNGTTYGRVKYRRLRGTGTGVHYDFQEAAAMPGPWSTINQALNRLEVTTNLAENVEVWTVRGNGPVKGAGALKETYLRLKVVADP